MTKSQKHGKQRADPRLIAFGVVAAIALTLFFVLLSRLIFMPSTNIITRSHEIGELVSIDRLYSVAVTKATFDNSIAPKLHLPDTERVLVLDVQVKNLSKQPLNYLPIIHTFLRDDQGNTYSFTPGLTSNVMQAKLITPGETLRGELAFIVPSEYLPLWFYFDAKFDDQGPISFRIVR